MQFDWYKPQLKSRLRELLILKEKASEKDEELIESTILAILDTFQHSRIDKNPSLETLLERDYLVLSKTRFLWPYIQDIASFPEEDIKLPNVSQISISDTDLRDIIHDFFRNYTNKKTYEIFLHFWCVNKTHMHFINDGPAGMYGNTFYLPYYKEAFIQIQRKGIFRDISTVSHEYGHAIQFFLNHSDAFFYDLFVFSEIVSTFFELISMEMCGKNDLFIAGTVSQFEMLSLRISDAVELEEEMAILKSIAIENYENKNDLRRKIKAFLEQNNNQEIKSLLMEKPSSSYPYSVGFLVAINLFMIYLKDQDKAFYLLYKLINIDLKLPADKYFEEITRLELTDTAQMISYEQHLKRKLIKP